MPNSLLDAFPIVADLVAALRVNFAACPDPGRVAGALLHPPNTVFTSRLTRPLPVAGATQIKVRDLSRVAVSVSPAEYASWNEARTELMVEAKKCALARITAYPLPPPSTEHDLFACGRPLMAQRQAELGAAAVEDHEAIRAEFEGRERALEHEIDFKPLELHMSLGVAYNFLR